MAVNWGPVGQQLAALQGGKQDIVERRLGDLAALDLKLQKAKGRRDARGPLIAAGYSPEEADLGAMLIQAEAGSDFANMERGLTSQQGRGFRQQAVDAYGTGGAEAANQYRAGLGTGMLDATKITAGQAYNPTVAPTSQDIVITDIGESVIGANNARAGASRKQGDAAIIRANKPAASRAPGGSGAAPKLSDVDKLRLKSAMEGIAAEKEAVLERIAQGDEAAKLELKAIQQEEEAVFKKFDGTDIAPEPDTDIAGGNLGDAVAREGTWYTDPETGQQRKVASPTLRATYEDAFAVANSLEAEAEAAIAAGADREKVKARLKAEILRRTKGK
jgi:hypothetical protein